MSNKTADVHKRGAFWGAAEVVQRVFVLHIWVLLASAPTIIGLPFVAPDPSNIPLFAMLALPVGPALAASIFAWQRLASDTERSVTHFFLRGYRLGWLDALIFWVLALVLLTILTTNLSYADTVFGGSALQTVWLILALVISLVFLNALVISALFSFRRRDVLRLAIFQLGGAWRTTLGFIAILICVAAATVLIAEWVLFFLAGPITWFIWVQARPLIDSVEADFTR